MPNIALLWDFDGTLTPSDSTSKTFEIVSGNSRADEFWSYVKGLRGDQGEDRPEWEHILASDAPIWMYALSRVAHRKGIPLNDEFFEKFVVPEIALFPGAIDFLKKVKSFEDREDFKELDIHIHHFIVSAGLKELIEQIFPVGLITWTFGCRYTVIVTDEEDKSAPESVPVFCIDETMKTRPIFEISKGAFCNKDVKVNTRVSKEDLWVPFENMIYIGDGPTDIPSLSLTRSQGGMGVVVYNPSSSKEKVESRVKEMRLDARADLITPADFSQDSELFDFLYQRCIQIKQRYDATRPRNN